MLMRSEEGHGQGAESYTVLERKLGPLLLIQYSLEWGLLTLDPSGARTTGLKIILEDMYHFIKPIFLHSYIYCTRKYIIYDECNIKTGRNVR